MSSMYFYYVAIIPPPPNALEKGVVLHLKFSLSKDLGQVWLKRLALICKYSGREDENMNIKIYEPT